MDNKIALEKMKQLLCDISSKNELLNSENNDLNIKIISLIKLLKSKDNQINILNKKLQKINLKNIFYKKYFIQKQQLQNAFDIFKYNTKNNNKIDNKPSKLISSRENDIFFSGIKLNYKDIGIGDSKINQKFFIRKVACLTFFKKRKNINNNDEETNNDIKINLKFKNIEQQNEVNNIYIKSERNKKKEKQEYECSIFNIEIKHINKLKIFDNKYLKSENICKNYSILSDRSYNLLKLKIEQKEKDIKKLENDLTNIKKDYSVTKKAMNEYMDKYNNLNNMIQKKRKKIIMDTKNKFCLNIKSKKKQKNEIIKINDISIISNDENKSNKENLFECYNNEFFDILAEKKNKLVLKKSNFNIILINNKINNNSNLIISKENNITFLNKNKSKIDKQYEIIEPLNYTEYKNNQIINKSFKILESSNSFSLNYTSPQTKRNEILKKSKSFYFEIINTREELVEKENISSSIKIIILDLKLRIIFDLKPKILFFIKLTFFYYQKKITESFKMFRNLLINLKLKILLKNKINGPSRFYFLKYYLSKYQSNTLYLSSQINKEELQKSLEANNKLNSQITLLQETFKKYEESNLKEKNEKDTQQ